MVCGLSLALLLAAVILFPNAVWGQAPARAGVDGCATCHAALPQTAKLVQAFDRDVHHDRGFGCSDCHGGDPSTSDKMRAKDPARGYLGRLAGASIIAACARCHSDTEFMRRFTPRPRVDQATEYATSVHGKRLATGDPGVATCASCHGAHGVLRVNDAKSPVYPVNVAATCGRCHSDSEYMKRYTLPDGSPIPTGQRADYEKSVHHLAMTKRDDLSAPTCNDCHGNHGAAPPGIDAVVNVCGSCHAVFAQRFEPSVHRQIFERGCVECHGNHAVLPTSDEMLGTSKDALCSACHTEGDNGFVAAHKMHASISRLKGAIDTSNDLIMRVGNAGIEISDQELALREARAQLTLARTEVHTSNPVAVDRPIQEGLKIVSRVERAGQDGLVELRYRRRGLIASLAAILLVVVALSLKIRSLERQQDLRRSG